MSDSQAATMRRRSRHLRALAGRIRTTPAMSLASYATVDTWRGPAAEGCVDDLARARRAADDAADELDNRAWWLERRAEELEAAALLAHGRTG